MPKISRSIEASQTDSEAAKTAYDLVCVSVAGETTRAFTDICTWQTTASGWAFG
ncbi:hypothetical protein [Iodobacter fluviatilis]|uniref:hypothetical protein n=1 Tax=Iodobacter fluviatilis TaxID=537 RepID=UPI00165E2162|nr:hypothetical protein [Iodobacter fluviatilis]